MTCQQARLATEDQILIFVISFAGENQILVFLTTPYQSHVPGTNRIKDIIGNIRKQLTKYIFETGHPKERARTFLAKKNEGCMPNLIWARGQTLIEGTYKIEQPNVSDTEQ